MIGSKFGKRPSALLGIRDDVVALDLDQAAALWLNQFENEQQAAQINAMFGKSDDDSPQYESLL